MSPLDPFVKQGAVDLTAFVGQWPWRLPVRLDGAALSAHADRLGLSALCVSHIASVFGFDTRSGNEELFELVRTDERLLPFPILNPIVDSGELGWLASMGARGIRLVPGYHGCSLGSPAVATIADAAADLGIPLQVCARLDDERLRHPRFSAPDVPIHELAELVRRNPRRRLILSGLRSAEWDALRAHLNATDDLSGVVADLWFVNGPVQVIRQICAAGQAAHYAYGSGTPIHTAEATALQLATADISAGHRGLLCRGNAERLLTRTSVPIDAADHRGIR
jgi:uncharacterized protein